METDVYKIRTGSTKKNKSFFFHLHPRPLLNPSESFPENWKNKTKFQFHVFLKINRLFNCKNYFELCNVVSFAFSFFFSSRKFCFFVFVVKIEQWSRYNTQGWRSFEPFCLVWKKPRTWSWTFDFDVSSTRLNMQQKEEKGKNVNFLNWIGSRDNLRQVNSFLLRI